MAKKEPKLEKVQEEQYIDDNDLVLNTSARIPVCLCLDTSGSMKNNQAIEALNKGVETLYNSIRNDSQASNSCEICVVTFDSEVKIVENFSTIKKKSKIKLKADGGSALAQGIIKSLDLLEKRKNEYKQNGVEYYQPWLVIITDGKPGDEEFILEAQERTKILLDEKKLTIFPVAVGCDTNKAKLKKILEVLDGFCLTPRAIHLKDLNFADLFEFIGKSVSVISASAIGESVKLDIRNMSDWAEL